jgi:hypothetical protein
MNDVMQVENPLDLDNAGRDELIDGLGTTPVPPQSDDTPAKLEPPHSERKKSSKREVDEQSAILSSVDVKKLTSQKPH